MLSVARAARVSATEGDGGEGLLREKVGADVSELFKGQASKHSNAAWNLSHTLRVARIEKVAAHVEAQRAEGAALKARRAAGGGGDTEVGVDDGGGAGEGAAGASACGEDGYLGANAPALRLSKTQRKAARRAAFEADDAAGRPVRISGVAYDKI